MVRTLLDWLRTVRRGRSIRDTYPVAVADVRQGTVAKVVGRLRYGPTRDRAPLTGRPCACWQVDVGAPVVHQEAAWRDFLIEDRTGVASVRFGSSVTLSLVKDVATVAGVGGTPFAFALRAGFGRREASIVRVREGILAEGDEVAVLGLGLWEPDPTAERGAATYRDRPRRLVLVQPAWGPLVCANDPFAIT